MQPLQIKVCRICIQPGHVVRECPEFVCYRCGKSGHYARECLQQDIESCKGCGAETAQCGCPSGENQEDGNIHLQADSVVEESEMEESSGETSERKQGQQQQGSGRETGGAQREDLAGSEGDMAFHIGASLDEVVLEEICGGYGRSDQGMEEVLEYRLTGGTGGGQAGEGAAKRKDADEITMKEIDLLRSKRQEKRRNIVAKKPKTQLT
ncbi:hypothetical protein DPEC_G00132510 [Dallia pectoralis]|uniref:Uncharacterized protein n=1 Tax=Dallia pectoralis TaxID=75939 RepID=A0ACC2GRF3_DALPE|nr:hypothetical protein DPEC_G00132510 [Dallia pectoralis]